jgi:hypothetical protein
MPTPSTRQLADHAVNAPITPHATTDRACTFKLMLVR